MNSKQLNLFRILLFVGGLVLVGIGFLIFNYPLPEEGLSAAQKFFWVEMVLCYLVFFIPFFFNSITTKMIDTQLIPTMNIWFGVIFFEIVAIPLAFLALNEIVSIGVSVFIELIIFIIAAIFIYFGYLTGNHIGKVKGREELSLSKIAELKSSFEMLNLKTDMWNDDLRNQKEQIKKLCDDVRYLSPVDTEMSVKLEMKLIVAANIIAESSISPSEMDSKILELTNLLNQRKLLRK